MFLLFLMGFLRRAYEKVMAFVGSYAAKDIGNVVSNSPDFSGFSFDDDYLRRQADRVRELEALAVRYETDLASARMKLESVRREADDMRNLAQYLKVQNREANKRRFAAERNVGAFDRFMRSRVCDLIEKGVNPLNGEQAGCYAFIDRQGNIISMSRAARKVLGYDESRPVDYHDIVSANVRMELADVRTNRTLEELSLKMAEGEKVIVRDVHVFPMIVGSVYAGTVVDFRGLTLLEKARTAWFESRARGLIEDVRARFKEKGLDSGAIERV